MSVSTSRRRVGPFAGSADTLRYPLCWLRWRLTYHLAGIRTRCCQRNNPSEPEPVDARLSHMRHIYNRRIQIPVGAPRHPRRP